MTKLLDTTLRDGSYVIDFQFTPKDTAVIGEALDIAGVDFIEVGHGLGLGAGSKPHMKSPAADEKYLEAAANAIKTNPWGMFLIPGIGTLEDIDLAAKHGMKFIRIGTDVDHSEKAAPYIERAKKHGMYVASNFMKTYALDFKGVAERAVLAQKYGADIVCIVDSAGGMFPTDVEGYFNAIKDLGDIPVGFHGHNNLGLAMANTLKAVKIGCDVVDTSIRGMGRSAGNAVTEMLLFSMHRLGTPMKTDTHKILQIAEEYIDPMLKNYQQVNSIGIVSGYAQFHSSFMGKISQYADTYQVDPKKLIINVSRIDKLMVTDQLVEEEARKLKQENQKAGKPVYAVSIPEYHFNAGDDFATQLQAGVELVKVMAKKYANKSVLNIVQDNRAAGVVSQVINEGNNFSIISATIGSVKDAKTIRDLALGKVDHILLDSDIKYTNSKDILSIFENIDLIVYSDHEIWAKAIVSIVLKNISSNFDASVFGIGESKLADNVRAQLANFNIQLLPGENFSDGIFILFDKLTAELSARLIGKKILLIDAVLGSVDADIMPSLLDNNINILRPQMHSFILAEVDAKLGTNQKHITVQGVGTVNDIKIASGGWVASKGTVIVDNVNRPRKIYGVANGLGFLLADNDMNDADRSAVKHLEQLLASKFAND